MTLFTYLGLIVFTLIAIGLVFYVCVMLYLFNMVFKK